MEKGKFIVIEGPDNVGKSTVAKLLSDWLNGLGIEALYTKHPGSTEVGAELRRVSKNINYEIDPTTEALINAADNSAFIDGILIPSLNEGIWIIGDRNNFISSLAYQIQSGVNLEELDKIHAVTHPNPPKIDILFILTANDENRAARKSRKRSKHVPDRYEDRSAEYSAGVTESYNKLMEEQSERLLKFVDNVDELGQVNPRVFYVDANQNIDIVFDIVKDTVLQLLIKTED